MITRGPWIQKPAQPDGIRIYGYCNSHEGEYGEEHESYVCNVHLGEQMYPGEHDAKLICAAPDLLKAASEAFLFIRGISKKDGLSVDKILQEAILKAGGK